MCCSLMGITKDLSLSFDFRQAGVGRDELLLAVRETERSDRLLSRWGAESGVRMSRRELFLVW